MIAGNDGSFSITSSVLADADYTLTVTATDEAGNTSVPSAGINITIDTTAPAAPLIRTSTSLTNINTPTIEGTAEAGSTVELFNGSDSLGTVIAADNGTFLFNSYGELIDGSYHLTATSTDTAGNISVSSHGLSIIVDTTEPEKPIIATTIAITNTDSPTITGTTAPGTTVTLLDGDNALGSVIAGNDGSFSITSSVLADASYTLTVTATDEAGNTSVPSTGLPITIDTTAPAAPLITTDIALTNINTPTIEGTAEAGSTVELFNGSDCSWNSNSC